MSTRHVADLVDAFLADRRPDRFVPQAGDLDAIRAAIALSAARPGAALPASGFILGLHGRLLAEFDDAEARYGDVRVVTRRRLVGGASAAVVAAVAGALLDAELRGYRGSSESRGEEALIPAGGRWQPVCEISRARPNAVVRFATPTLIGFVVKDATRLHAVVGVCTHQGCVLQYSEAKGRLDCPCHRASFTLDGAVSRHDFEGSLSPLPRLAARERNGMIEVYVPPEV